MQKLPKCKNIPKKFWYPEDSSQVELKVYRLTFNSDRVCAEDFLSKYELDTKYGKDTKRFENDDIYYGLSVFEDYEDAKKCLRKMKCKNLNGISEGVTFDGLIRKTPTQYKSHTTWWPFETATNIEAKYIIVGGNENE